MMLIGLGEPFLDPKIFERIEYCDRHGISTLLSTNGTLLDEETAERLLATPLEHITLSFDGATQGDLRVSTARARGSRRCATTSCASARMKHERRAKVQVVVQMVRMERNAGEVEEFTRFWSAVPGVDQVRIKEDETNLMRPEAGHAAEDWKHPCHYLWRGPMYVKHNGDVYPCCQSYMLDGRRWATWASSRWRRSGIGGDAADAAAARRGPGGRDRHLLALLHDDSASRCWWPGACCCTGGRCGGCCPWWSGWRTIQRLRGGCCGLRGGL